MRIRVRPLSAAILSVLLIGSTAASQAAPAPSPAAEAATPTEASPTPVDSSEQEGPPEEAAAGEVQAGPLFTLRYQIGGDLPRPLEVYEADPIRPLLGILRESATAALGQKGGASPVTTTVAWPIPEEVREILGEIPVLTIITAALQDGRLESRFEVLPYQHQVTKEGETGTIAWEGLTGQVTYQDAELRAPQLVAAAPGGHAHIDADNTDMGFKGLALNLTMNADWEPRLVDFKLPEMSFSGADGELSLQGLHMEADVKSVPPGVDVGTGGVGFKTLTFRNGDQVFQMDDVAMDARTDLKGKAVDTSVAFRLSHAFISAALSPSGAVDFSFENRFELQNLDAEVIADLQRTVREMQRQVQAGQMSEDMVGMVILGKVMEVLPRLWQGSPVLAMPRMRIATQDGSVEASFRVAVDGSKPMNTQSPEAMKAAIKGEGDFRITRPLLERIVAAQYQAAQANPPGEAVEETPADEAKVEGQGAVAEATPPPASQPEAPRLGDTEIAEHVQAEIASYVQGGFLTADGDNYRMKTSYVNGKLMVNGQEMATPF